MSNLVANLSVIFSQCTEVLSNWEVLASLLES